ncbi:MAG: hypothetical protein K9K34_06205 [Desulfarculaceae bacterium]|nr:hypothetical protein [Desulfarculaceae bacterium]
MRSKNILRALTLLLLALTLGMGAAWPAAAEPTPEALELARRLVRLKPLDYRTIAQIMEIDCLQGMAGSKMGRRLDLDETKKYCQVVGDVFWFQIKDQVNEAMAQSYAHYLTQRELEVIIEGLIAERRGRASKYPPQETKTVVGQLRRVDPGIKAETSWQIKQITRRWQERFALDSYFKKQFREQVLEKLPWKIRSKLAY